jgi:hypothetical protein
MVQAASFSFASSLVHQTSRAGSWLADGRPHLHQVPDRVKLLVLTGLSR